MKPQKTTLQNEEDTRQYDLIIVGGGLAGASLAVALKSQQHSNYKVALIEAFALNTKQQPCYDDRTVALSYGSRLILQSMAQWQRLKPFAEAINNIHISDRGHFGVTRLNHEQEKVEALGYVLENRDIGEQLYKTIERTEKDNNSKSQNQDKNKTIIDFFCPARVEQIEHTKSHVLVNISHNKGIKKIKAKLLVAADGNNSQIMKMLNIGSSKQSYHQSAVITNVSTQKKHNNVAYERFTDSGPLAFLPMTKNRSSVVWSVPTTNAKQLKDIDEKQFIKKLQQQFGYRLGEITKAGKRSVYPLILQNASQIIANRVAIIGNAAHSVHPVAGQGFNLALRDIACLNKLIAHAKNNQQDIGAPLLLQNYQQQRQLDIKQTYRFTDTLVKVFSNKITPLAHARALGLLTVDIIPTLKHQLAKQSMGLNGRLSASQRGLRI